MDVTLMFVDEKIDILDEHGEPTGEIIWKSEAHRLGLWHRCFHCWISGTDSGGMYLLVQRRAAAKDTWPGWLDVSAAGHLAAGEKTLDGLRELDEELGLRVESDRLIPLGTDKIEQEIAGGFDREFHEIFLLLDSTPPQNLSLQKEEVESVVRIALKDAETLGDERSIPAVEWKEGKPHSIQISAADFVPNDSRLWRVARTARQTLSGESPGPIFSP